MGFLVEVGMVLVGKRLLDLLDVTVDLKEEQLKQAQMQSEIMRLQTQINQMQQEVTIDVEEPLCKPDEYDLEVMRNFAYIRQAIAEKK